MSEPYKYLGGDFTGPWTEDEADAFIQRVEEIRERERKAKEASDGEK